MMARAPAVDSEPRLTVMGLELSWRNTMIRCMRMAINLDSLRSRTESTQKTLTLLGPGGPWPNPHGRSSPPRNAAYGGHKPASENAE